MNKVVLCTIEILIQIFAIAIPASVFLKNYKDEDINDVAIKSYMIGILTMSITIIAFYLVDMLKVVNGG